MDCSSFSNSSVKVKDRADDEVLAREAILKLRLLRRRNVVYLVSRILGRRDAIFINRAESLGAAILATAEYSTLFYSSISIFLHNHDIGRVSVIQSLIVFIRHLVVLIHCIQLI